MRSPTPVWLLVVAASSAFSFWAGSRRGEGDGKAGDAAQAGAVASTSARAPVLRAPPPTVSAPPAPGAASLLSVADAPTEAEERMSPVDRARAAFDDPNEFRRLQKFHRALARLTPADAAMIEGLFDENNKLGRYFVPEFAFFTRRWGEVDGPAALAFAMKKWPAAASHMAGNVSQMAAGWATQSPQAAVDWLNSRTDALPWIQDAVMAGLVEGLAKRDLEWARKLVESRLDESGVVKNLSVIADEFIYTKGMASAEQWFDALPATATPRLRGQMFAHIISRKIRAGAPEAAAYVDRYLNEPWFDQGAGIKVANHYLKTDPAGAKQWAATLPPHVAARSVIEASTK